MNEMALVTALAVLAPLALALAQEEGPTGPKIQIECIKDGNIQCEDPAKQSNGACKDVVKPDSGDSKISVQITKKGTILALTCPATNYIAQPPPATPEKEQEVFTTDKCQETAPLKTYCSGATGKTDKKKQNALELSFPTVPCELGSFYLHCKPNTQANGNKACTVHVILPLKPQAGRPEGVAPPGSGQATSPVGVQTCEKNKGPITVSVPGKESVAQFACDSGFTLYPTEPNKVFSKNCKTQEELQDMTRTETKGAESAGGKGGAATPTYTLKANKKPAKKTLCYLCATTGTKPDALGTAENYCIIYVESSAGTQFGLSFIVALALPCVLAVFQFT